MIKQSLKKTLIALTLIIGLVIVFSLFFENKEKFPQVISTDPEANTEEVSESKQISINFNEDITEDVKKNISVRIEPQIGFDSTWLSNTYKVIPNNKLSNNTRYSLFVLFNNESVYTFSFNTQTFSQEDIQTYGSLQSQDDYIFGQEQKAFFEENSFYSKLPIRSRYYIVDYNFELKKFAISFLVDNIEPEQKEKLIDEALEHIKSIGIEEPIQYYTQF